MSITITETAATKIKELISEYDLPVETTGLRFGIVGGGCSGFEYKFELSENPEKTDQVFEQSGAKLFCDKKSYLFLNGVQLDYQKSVMSQGFVVTNPNAKGGCGCGKSFSV